MTVRVLVVEDEQLAAEAHVQYVARTPGFEVHGVARSAAEAARLLGAGGVDLMLLDMHLPDGHGLDLLRRLRGTGHPVDVVAVTAARDADVVRQAVAQGVVLYLIKPFTFADFSAKLRQYAEFRERLAAGTDELAQDDVDQLLGTLRQQRALPKGLSQDTLREVTDALRTSGAARSASEVAEQIGASRVTVRRYLEHLAESGVVERHSRYGGGGRPEVEYRWT